MTRPPRPGNVAGPITTHPADTPRGAGGEGVTTVEPADAAEIERLGRVYTRAYSDAWSRCDVDEDGAHLDGIAAVLADLAQRGRLREPSP
jgi:hypothetical protein